MYSPNHPLTYKVREREVHTLAFTKIVPFWGLRYLQNGKPKLLVLMQKLVLKSLDILIQICLIRLKKPEVFQTI